MGGGDVVDVHVAEGTLSFDDFAGLFGGYGSEEQAEGEGEFFGGLEVL